jgi:imidazolonepropionase-like amidohydrolase
VRLAALLLPLVLLAASPATAGPLAVHADELHLGDGRVLSPGVVLLDGDRIRAVGPAASVRLPADADLRRVSTLLPGLVAAVAPPAGPDAESIDSGRRALDLVDRLADRSSWIESGITAVAVSPGSERLVSGRGGVLRLTEAVGSRGHVADGPLHVVLTPRAHRPPLVFVPNVPVNVDAPLNVAEPQRPHSPSAAVAELRRLLDEARSGSGDPAFEAVLAGRARLAVHADRKEEIARALELTRGRNLRLVIVGGTESWQLADELAEAGASVWLTDASTRLASPDASRGEWRPDVATRLSSAGVPVALAVDAAGGRPAPLLAAASAVRNGLGRGEAIAAVTGLAADLAGAPDLGRIRAGGPADLVAFDGPALTLHARPSLVVVDGLVRLSLDEDDDDDLLVLRAGRLTTAELTVREASLVVSSGRVRGVESGTAVPAGAEIHDFGPDAVIVPGSIDALAWIGLEQGPPASGGARVMGSQAVETDHPSLGRALASGVTTTLAAPWTGGPLRGRPELVSTALLPADEDAGRRRASLEVLKGPPAPFLFWLDGGPGDAGARGGRTQALSGMLRKAKGYHDKWTAFEKKDEKKPDAKAKKKSRSSGSTTRLSDPRNRPGRGDATPSSKNGKPPRGGKDQKKAPETSPELEPWRDLFRGKAKAIVRAGRHDSILDALKTFKGAGLTPVLLGGEEADLVAGELAKAKVSVILRPNLTRMHEGESVLVSAALRRAGVSVAFGSQGLGATDRLPLLAADAVRLGLSPSDALRALTVDAAAATGAAGGLGRLAVGDRADCVVYSGDPLEPASRVLAVVVRGRLVHQWGDDLSGLGQ